MDQTDFHCDPIFDQCCVTIRANGITILEDSYKEIKDDLVLAGRADAAWGNNSGRASVKGILQNVDRNKFIIMVDHQPIEAEENEAQGVDLELSGHTHAGQIWPAGVIRFEPRNMESM